MEQEQKIQMSMSIPFMIGGVVLILLIVAGIYFFTDMGKDPQVVREKQKASLLERITETNNPLSEQEKLNILQKYGGSNTAQYNFTAEEKNEILRALNGR